MSIRQIIRELKRIEVFNYFTKEVNGRINDDEILKIVDHWFKEVPGTDIKSIYANATTTINEIIAKKNLGNPILDKYSLAYKYRHKPETSNQSLINIELQAFANTVLVQNANIEEEFIKLLNK